MSFPAEPELAGLALGLAGLVLLLNPAAIDWSSQQVLAGCGLLIAGAMAGAAALVHVRAHRWQGTPFDVQIGSSSWPSYRWACWRCSSNAIDGTRWTGTWAVVLVVLYSGALATAFAFWASQSIVRVLGPTTTSIGYLAVPVAGILSGVVVLGEPVGVLDILGLLVTSAGIVVVLRGQRGTQARAAGVAEEVASVP